ncbi:peroxisomal 2,4-dienoyl-CoA reductase isoform X4 [Camelus ferus]|uniref:Nucleoside diphosphate kinase, mitochondrial n=1 Tax=Camelus ferus TaxID=419612 RepID=A0A8B8RF39_CAMFR|nr:peroxisomal 2,4-dienoyl-CoA reductase isoform X4 [Camelus ferus]
MGRLSARAALRGLLCGVRAPGPKLLARPSSGGPSWTRERTLVAVKPDGVQRRLVGDVIQRFERRGFKLVGMKMLQASESVLAEHYHDLQRKPFYPALISYMSSGPVVAMVWEGPNVVCTSRAMIGHTNSAEAAPGTIRGDFSIHISRDKVAFITGGGSGIGFRIAEIFMRHGCYTVIASRSLPRVSMAARKLAAATGQRCLPLSLDVRSPLAITAAVEQALKEFGKIDILINCAAGNFLCPAGTLSSNAFKTVMDIDTLGTFNVSRILYEKFFRDHGGVIVNITATLGTRGQVLQVHAGSAKAAVDAMTRHLAVEWGPQNIRVNSLAPGLISGTEGFQRLGGLQAGLNAKVLASPLKRLGNKTEIAHSALFLASPLASYMTGAVLVVDACFRNLPC